MYDSGPRAAKQLEGGARLLPRHLNGPLAARLSLEAMRLVNNPVPDRRENLPLRRNVSQQQRVIRHNHVRGGGTAARSVERAFVGKVRAPAAQALAGRRGKHGARHVAPPDAEGVEVTVGRLTGIRVCHRDCREHVARHRVVRPPVMGHRRQRQVLPHRPVKTVQAGVVVIPLEARIGEPPGKGRGKGGELVGDQLVGERVGLCCHANGDVVPLGEERLGEQVCDGLPYARAGLDRAVRRGGKRRCHLARHCNLLRTSLHMLIHVRDHAGGTELGRNLVGSWHHEPVELGRVGPGLATRLADERCPDLLERERTRGHVSLRRQVREDGPHGPRDLLVHGGEVGEKALGEVAQGEQQDPPHPREGINVVAGPVGHSRAPEGLRHVRKAVRGEPRQRDARERESVYPCVGHLGAARDRLDEGAVEGRVVCKHGRARNELRKTGHGVPCTRCVRDVTVGYARELGDLLRNGSRGVHERLIARHNLAPGEAGGGYLDELAVLERESRGLGVEHHDVLLERTEPPAPGALGKAQVALPHVLGRPREDDFLEGGAVVLCHQLIAILPALERVLDEPRAQLGKLDAAVAGGVRKQALRRHAGNRVGLQNHGLPIGGHNEVTSGAAPAAEGAVRPDGEVLSLRVYARRQAGRDDMMHGRRLVLDLEVIELGPRHNLDDGERARLFVSYDRNGDLRPFNALLDEHAPAAARRPRDGVVDARALRHARDAERGAVRRGLHEERQAELANERVHLVVREDRARGEVHTSGRANLRGLVHRL